MWGWLKSRKDITANDKLRIETANNLANGVQRQLIQEQYRMANSNSTSSNFQMRIVETCLESIMQTGFTITVSASIQM